MFIYIGNSVKAIKYRCKVNKVNLDNVEIDDSEFVRNGDLYENYYSHMALELTEEFSDTKYSLDVLKNKGLKGNMQGPRHANGLVD